MCPLPALKLRHALKSALPGQRLRIVCTDPMSAIDIPNLISQTGDLFVEQSAVGGEYRFLVEKA